MTVLDPRPMASPVSAEMRPLPNADPITRLPVLILYPHSRCNCRCIMCDIWRSSGREELSVEEVSRWVSEFRSLGVERVVLSGGEALLHSDLWALCDVLRSADIGITVLSTGLLLARHAERLVTVCDDVVVSLDGPREIHDSIRNVPRAFDRLGEGIRAVKTVSASVAVSARCTVQRANHRDLRATVRAAHELGLDRISFLAADVSSSAFNRPEGWTPDRVDTVALSKEDLPHLGAELDAMADECEADFASGFIAESPAKLRQRLLEYYAALNGEGEFHRNRCNAPWVSAVIETDGTVRPCFFQPALGNIRSAKSLTAVLNSPDAIAWRRGLDIERDAICRRCVCTLQLTEPALDA
jgi:MoaA/NifB/PqqE/SkfB family radical SAM enzyme